MPNENYELKWDQDTERFFETGIEKVALYLKTSSGYGDGVAWNGVTAINESPSGAEPTALYANNSKYAEIVSNEDFGFTIEAYTYPDEFAACNGEKTIVKGAVAAQQERQAFGLAYTTRVGNDVDGTGHAYKLHLIYGALAKPTEMAHNTINDSPDIEPMSWECSTTPTEVTGMKPTSHIIIDSREADSTKLTALLATIYGGSAKPKLPSPAEVITALTPST